MSTVATSVEESSAIYVTAAFPPSFLTNPLYIFLFIAMRTICSAKLIFIDFFNLSNFGEQYKVLRSSLKSLKNKNVSN
jgi:hypothetical protein